MNEDQKSAEEKKNRQIRHDLVNTAVSFLLNPSVINKPYEQKAAFLRKKGLTEAEIALAYEKAESNPNYNQIQQGNVSNDVPVLPPPVPVYRPISFWSQLSRFSSSLIVLGVAVFGAHYVYKKYIEPLIYGEENESKSQKWEKQLLDMAESISQLQKNVSSLEDSISCQKEQMGKFIQNEVNEYYPTPLALKDLKTEIASVKSLLLNRHQFPALPKVSPTIPVWQLPSNENGDDNSKQNEELSQHSCKSSCSNPDTGVTDNDTSSESNGTKDIVSEVESTQHEHSEKLNIETPTC